MKTHKMSRTRFYKIWRAILYRTTNKNATSYKIYGGRGIKCLWESFEEFRDDMYQSYLEHVEIYGKKNTSIDRVDNNGHYYKENCRWATRSKQCRNRRSNFVIKYKGVEKCVIEWSELFNLHESTLRYRLNKLGWSVEKTLTKPARRLNRGGKYE